MFIIDTPRRFIRNLIRSIKSVVVWLPTIWRDRDWDYVYLFLILRKKLSLMEKFFASDKALTANHKEVANNIKECREILDRLIEDNYLAEKYDKHYEKWGQPEFNIEGENLEITYKNVKTEEDEITMRKEFRELAIKEMEEKENDKNLLFEKMAQSITSWWD